MVDEAADVPVEASVDAVHLAVLGGGKESRELQQEPADLQAAGRNAAQSRGTRGLRVVGMLPTPHREPDVDHRTLGHHYHEEGGRAAGTTGCGRREQLFGTW